MNRFSEYTNMSIEAGFIITERAMGHDYIYQLGSVPDIYRAPRLIPISRHLVAPP